MAMIAEEIPSGAEIAAAEDLDAALFARRLGVTDREVREAFGTEASELAALSARLVGRSGRSAPEPPAAFVSMLEARLRTEHPRRHPGAGVGILPLPLLGGWSSAAIMVGAALLAVSTFLASGGHGPGPARTPTAWAATSTATGTTPAASATQTAPVALLAHAHHLPAPVAPWSLSPLPEATVDG